MTPPINWTSKWRISRTRFPASQTTANVSGRRSSSGSPFSTRWRNSAIFAASRSSERGLIEDSSAFTRSTVGRIRSRIRSFCVPNIFFSKSPNMKGVPPVWPDIGCNRKKTPRRGSPHVASGSWFPWDFSVQEARGVHREAVHADLVVQVGPCGTPRGTDFSQFLSPVDERPLLDAARRQVAIDGPVPRAVVDDDHVSIQSLVAALHHDARSRRQDRRPGLGDDVQAVVENGGLGERGVAHPEHGREGPAHGPTARNAFEEQPAAVEGFAEDVKVVHVDQQLVLHPVELEVEKLVETVRDRHLGS